MFSLPTVKQALDLGMFQEFAGHSYLFTEVDGEKTLIFYIARSDIEEGKEFDSSQQELHCELEAEESTLDTMGGLSLSICRWKKISGK